MTTDDRCKKNQLAEDFLLDKDIRIPNKLARNLPTYQLEGIRFLHRNYINNKNIILNDDIKLGKCFQTVVFLTTIITPSVENDCMTCLIVSQNRQKLLNWLYHIDTFTTIKSTYYSNNCSLSDGNVIIAHLDDIKSEALYSRTWNYLVIDESTSNFDSHSFKQLQQIKSNRRLFISPKDITTDIERFRHILEVIDKLTDPTTLELLNNWKYLRKREQLQDFCRSFRLRRYTHDVKKSLPLIEVDDFLRKFTDWNRIRELNSKAALAMKTGSSDLFQFKECEESEEMAPLYLEPDSTETQSIVSEIQSSQESIRQHRRQCDPVRKVSSDVEVISSGNAPQSPITVYSSTNDSQYPQTNQQRIIMQQLSPDLFDSVDEDGGGGDKISQFDFGLISSRHKQNGLKVSTPNVPETPALTFLPSILSQHSEDLFDFGESELEVDDISVKDCNKSVDVVENHLDKSDVFEITKNDDFDNLLRFNSAAELSPIKTAVTSSKNDDDNNRLDDELNILSLKLFDSERPAVNQFSFLYKDLISSHSQIDDEHDPIELDTTTTDTARNLSGDHQYSQQFSEEFLLQNGQSFSFGTPKSSKFKINGMEKTPPDSQENNELASNFTKKLSKSHSPRDNYRLSTGKKRRSLQKIFDLEPKKRRIKHDINILREPTTATTTTACDKLAKTMITQDTSCSSKSPSILRRSVRLRK